MVLPLEELYDFININDTPYLYFIGVILTNKGIQLIMRDENFNFLNNLMVFAK